jgi:hypothetical protein
MKKIIILFHSTRDAINAERTCLRKGIICQAIPVPRDLSADCGIALEVNGEDETAVKTLFNTETISGVFQKR